MILVELNPDGGPHRHIATITIPGEAWEPTGPTDNPRARLLSRIAINGVGFHLTAIEVTVKDDTQVATLGDEEFDLLHGAFGADGRYDTITVDGRTYVLFGDCDC